MSFVYFRVFDPFVEAAALGLKGRVCNSADSPLAENDFCVVRVFVVVVGGRNLSGPVLVDGVEGAGMSEAGIVHDEVVVKHNFLSFGPILKLALTHHWDIVIIAKIPSLRHIKTNN